MKVIGHTGFDKERGMRDSQMGIHILAIINLEWCMDKVDLIGLMGKYTKAFG